MGKHRVMLPGEDLLSSPLKLAKWLNKFTEANNLELVAVDNGLFYFRSL